MALQQERIGVLLERLKMRRMGELYEGLAEEASKKDWTYVDYLEQLLEAESSLRLERATALKIRVAHFPFHKTLDQFEFAFQPGMYKKQLKALSTMKFVSERENVLFLGPPGVGKTHLAIALGLEAIQAGHSVYFIGVQELVSWPKHRPKGNWTDG